jgi:hypothetical protein
MIYFKDLSCISHSATFETSTMPWRTIWICCKFLTLPSLARSGAPPTASQMMAANVVAGGHRVYSSCVRSNATVSSEIAKRPSSARTESAWMWLRLL